MDYTKRFAVVERYEQSASRNDDRIINTFDTKREADMYVSTECEGEDHGDYNIYVYDAKELCEDEYGDNYDIYFKDNNGEWCISRPGASDVSDRELYYLIKGE